MNPLDDVGGICVTDKDVEKLIMQTVNTTILKLKTAGLMQDDRQSAYQKTETLLRNYDNFRKSIDQPYARKVVGKIEKGLEEIRGDIYYEIIPMYYFQGDTRENIADYFGTTGTTISRNKKRLVNQLKALLFSDDMIYELFL